MFNSLYDSVDVFQGFLDKPSYSWIFWDCLEITVVILISSFWSFNWNVVDKWLSYHGHLILKYARGISM